MPIGIQNNYKSYMSNNVKKDKKTIVKKVFKKGPRTSTRQIGK